MPGSDPGRPARARLCRSRCTASRSCRSHCCRRSFTSSATPPANAGAALLASAGCAVAALAGAGVWALVAAAGALPGAAGGLRLDGGAQPAAARPDGSPRRWRRAARPAAASSFLLLAVISFVALNMDYVIVGRVADVAQLGLYSLAFTIAFAPLTQFAWQIGKVLFPAAARAGIRYRRGRSRGKGGAPHGAGAAAARRPSRSGSRPRSAATARPGVGARWSCRSRSSSRSA